MPATAPPARGQEDTKELLLLSFLLPPSSDLPSHCSALARQQDLQPFLFVSASFTDTKAHLEKDLESPAWPSTTPDYKGMEDWLELQELGTENEESSDREGRKVISKTPSHLLCPPGWKHLQPSSPPGCSFSLFAFDHVAKPEDQSNCKSCGSWSCAQQELIPARPSPGFF